MYQMQKPRSRQGSLPYICELFGRRGTDAIKSGGISGAKCGTHALVRDLSSISKERNGQLSPIAEVYPNPAATVLQLLYELMMDRTPTYRMQTEMLGFDPAAGPRVGFQGCRRGRGGMGPR